MSSRGKPSCPPCRGMKKTPSWISTVTFSVDCNITPDASPDRTSLPNACLDSLSTRRIVIQIWRRVDGPSEWGCWSVPTKEGIPGHRSGACPTDSATSMLQAAGRVLFMSDILRLVNWPVAGEIPRQGSPVTAPQAPFAASPAPCCTAHSIRGHQSPYRLRANCRTCPATAPPPPWAAHRPHASGLR